MFGGTKALLQVGGGQQYTSVSRELIPCAKMDFETIMSAIQSNSGRYGYVDVVLELQHTAESVPRAVPPSARIDGGSGEEEWDWGGTKVDGVSTPMRPGKDNF